MSETNGSEHEQLSIDPGIYMIVCVKTRKRYIGSAQNIKRRWLVHQNLLRKRKHYNEHLQNSWDLYGSGEFIIEILEYVEDFNELVEREQYYIDLFEPELNMDPIAGSRMGSKTSEETKKKMSLSHTGISTETRKKMAESLRGRPRSIETRKKISESQQGKTLSIEHRQNISIGLTGRIVSDKTAEKISQAKKGKRFSEEHRKSLSVAQKARWERWRLEHE